MPVDMAQLEERAREKMSPEGFAYMAGGAGMESTMRANRAAFERWRIVLRMLRDVSARDTSVDLFGTTFRAPLLLAPIGVLEMADEDADLAVARAAAAEGVPMIFSSQASYSMEVCAEVMGDSPRWFQLYWSKSDDLVASFVRRAEAAGCGAIVLTLDTTMLGWRPRDLDLGYLPFLRGKGIAQYSHDSVFQLELSQPLEAPSFESPAPVNLATLKAFAQMVRKYPDRLLSKLRSGEPCAAVQRFIATYSRPSPVWDDLDYLRDLTDLPILLKGILHPDDAREAVNRGMNGIIVSNHGGRQVDGAIGALDALPAVVEAVGGRIPRPFRQWDPRRCGCIPGAGARCDVGVPGAAVCIWARACWRGGSAGGDPKRACRLRSHHGAGGVYLDRRYHARDAGAGTCTGRVNFKERGRTGNPIRPAGVAVRSEIRRAAPRAHPRRSPQQSCG